MGLLAHSRASRQELDKVDISVEIIDAQSLIPFDINHDTVKSVQKTNNLLIVDEDVEGGASAYLMQEIVEKQNAYRYWIASHRHLLPNRTDLPMPPMGIIL